MKKILRVLNTFSKLSKNIFTYALFIYLLLFLSENLFTGFVSNFSNLNLLLVPILLFGICSAFAQEKKEKEDHKKISYSDYLFIAFLSIIALAISFYKTKNMGSTGLLISLSVGFLIFISSFILFYMEDEVENEKEETLTILSKPHHKILNHTKLGIKFASYLFLNKIKIFIVIPLLVIIITLSVSLGFQFRTKFIKSPEKIKINQITKKQHKKEVPANRIMDKEEYVNTFEENEFGMLIKGIDITTLQKTPITVIDSGASNITLTDALRILIDNKCIITKVKKDNRGNYKNATIKFQPQDLLVAEYIDRLLKNNFTTIERTPLGSGESGVILIIGPTK